MTEAAGTVLVVEDNRDHALLVRIAVARTFSDLDVRVVGDGEEAIRYLEGEDSYADRAEHPVPGLVILDLVTPRVNGFAFLEWKREKPDLDALPVVVFTSSVNPGDESKTLELGAKAFYTKPSTLDELGRTVRRIIEEWFL